MSWTGSFHPVYKIQFWSGSTLLHGFGAGYTNFISSFRIKPGLTSAIGSFEIVIPDTGSNASGFATGQAFGDIDVYQDVEFWYGYTGSNMSFPLIYQFYGKIDSKKVDFADGSGYIRTFVGRDYGEALFRILERRGFTGSTTNTVYVLRDDSGLSGSNEFIEVSGNIYPITLSNENCFRALKEVSDFDNRDFYVDAHARVHWFERQSGSGAETFVEGTNILSYRLFKDVTEVYNQYYVFGMRDSANITGSDWPINHDDWTEPNATNWTAWIKSGSGPAEGVSVTPAITATQKATGSNSIKFADISGAYSDTQEWYLKFDINGSASKTLMLNDGDILHLYSGRLGNAVAYQNFYPTIRLETDSNNYFECKLEHEGHTSATTVNWYERPIYVGPSYEGVSTTGSLNTYTGSYKWTRIGSPDWYNINSFKMYITKPTAGVLSEANYFIDGLYFGTRWQMSTSSATSVTAYGARPKVVMDDKYTSNQYCTNVGSTLLGENSTPTTQIEVTTLGLPNLVMGNKYLLTLLSENINSNHELIDLEHKWENDSFLSKCLFTDKKQMRIPIPIINYPIQRVNKDYEIWLELHRGPKRG